MYLSQFRVPNASLRMKDSQINAVCTHQMSSIYHDIELNLDGSLDTDKNELRYGGVFGILNSGTLTSIIGTSTLPQEFVLKASGLATVSIDTSAAGISLANGISVGVLNGVDGNYVKISQQSGILVITEAYTS
jgi:hypothetical protein